MSHSAAHEIRALKIAEASREVYDFDHNKFPKTLNIVVSADKAAQFELGEKAGLSIWAIQNTFSKLGIDLKIRIILEYDGTAAATHLNDIPLEKPVRLGH